MTIAAEEKFEAFRNFGGSRYAVTISRCQQLALSKASGAVPLPSEQLALANQKREKEPRSYHVVMKELYISTKVLLNLARQNLYGHPLVLN